MLRRVLRSWPSGLWLGPEINTLATFLGQQLMLGSYLHYLHHGLSSFYYHMTVTHNKFLSLSPCDLLFLFIWGALTNTAYVSFPTGLADNAPGKMRSWLTIPCIRLVKRNFIYSLVSHFSGNRSLSCTCCVFALGCKMISQLLNSQSHMEFKVCLTLFCCWGLGPEACLFCFFFPLRGRRRVPLAT